MSLFSVAFFVLITMTGSGFYNCLLLVAAPLVLRIDGIIIALRDL